MVPFSNLLAVVKKISRISPNLNWIIFDPSCSLTEYCMLLIQHVKFGLWMCLELLLFSYLELNCRDDCNSNCHLNTSVKHFMKLQIMHFISYNG